MKINVIALIPWDRTVGCCFYVYNFEFHIRFSIANIVAKMRKRSCKRIHRTIFRNEILENEQFLAFDEYILNFLAFHTYLSSTHVDNMFPFLTEIENYFIVSYILCKCSNVL